jgi:trigger factor
MKTNLEDISAVKKKVTVEIDPEEVKSRLDKAYREIAKKAKIPGFRPGKAPRSILVRHFSTQIAEDVSRDLINESFPKALEESKAMPLGTPLLEKDPIKEGEGFTYSAIMEVRPSIELPEYKGLEVEKEKAEVSDEDVEKRLEQIRNANGKLQSLEDDRPIKNGDMALIDYQAYEQDKAIGEMSAENFLLEIGSGDLHPIFEKSLVGAGKDEEKEIEVPFEEDFHHQAVAGKKILFKVKVRDIKEVILPELNDEFAKKLGDEFKDLGSLKEKIRELLSEEASKRTEKDLKERIVKKISDSVQFELPQVLVDSELEYAVQGVRQNLLRSGSSIEKAGFSEQKLREEFRPGAETRCKHLLILGEIASKEDILVDEEDIQQGIRDIALSTGQPPETIRKYYEAGNMMDSLRESLIEQKTLNYLVENAKVIEVDKLSSEN